MRKALSPPLIRLIEAILGAPRRGRPLLVPIRVEPPARPIRRGGSCRRSLWVLAACLVLARADSLLAQGRVRDFTEPVLVHNSEGHHAPVKSLIFPKADGSVLLSGGLDKVVHQWNLDGPEAAPARTLRPPLWSGKRGEIRSMALSPTPDAQGQHILAVAGNGIAYNYADIVLFRYPGLDLAGQATGDLIAHLPSASIDAADAGHRDTILQLAFDPSGARLATASLDGTVRIWDVARRASVATMTGHSGGVSGLAWLGENSIATGDMGGNVRVWEVAPRPRQVVAANVAGGEPREEGLDIVRALVATADGRSIAVADARGRITRYDAPTLANATRFLPRPNQGGILALALSADGSKVAASYERRVLPGAPADWSNRESDVELRSFLDGSPIATLATLGDYVTALGFSPDNRRLVYAGGPDQAIHVRGINPVVADEVARVYRGHGASVRELAFAPEGLGIALSRDRVGAANPGGDEWDGFDLTARRPQTYPSATLDRAVASLGGWTIEPVSPTRVDVVHQNGFRTSISLRPNVEGHYWCSTLLAPRNAGEHPLIAVGCTSGVAIHSLAPTPSRIRFLAGHEGDVLAIAPSRDGRWLATGGNDQTVRLWTLAGIEKVPGLGAKLERGTDGQYTFRDVERGGFVDAMGIANGDRAKSALIDGAGVDLGQLVGLGDAALPGPDRNIMIEVLKPGPGEAEARTLRAMTSKRQNPALTLFLADRPAGEWVAWTPAGFYDTSIAGDGTYLGWHLNQSATLALAKPTVYFKIDRFRDRLFQPEVLRALLATGDEGAAAAQVAGLALAEPKGVVMANRPPQVGAIAAKLGENLARVKLQASALSGKFIREVRVSNGPRPVQTIAQPANPARLEQEFEVPLQPGENRIGLAVEDDNGRVETRWIDLASAAPPAREPRLMVIAIGAENFATPDLPSVPHAERDATALVPFLADRLISPETGKPFPAARVERRVIAGSKASAEELSKAIEGLTASLRKGDLRSGDVLALAIESQLLVYDRKPLLAGADLAEITPPQPSISAIDLADRLGDLSAAGVRVLLFLDLVHRDLTAPEAAAVADWIKGLRDRQGVVTAVASGVRRPSEPRLVNGRVSFPTLKQRVFAQGLLNSTTARAGRKVRVDDSGRLTLDGFGLTVNDAVRELTRGKQLTGLYVPDSISPNVPLIDTAARASASD